MADVGHLEAPVFESAEVGLEAGTDEDDVDVQLLLFAGLIVVDDDLLWVLAVAIDTLGPRRP